MSSNFNSTDLDDVYDNIDLDDFYDLDVNETIDRLETLGITDIMVAFNIRYRCDSLHDRIIADPNNNPNNEGPRMVPFANVVADAAARAAADPEAAAAAARAIANSDSEYPQTVYELVAYIDQIVLGIGH